MAEEKGESRRTTHGDVGEAAGEQATGFLRASLVSANSKPAATRSVLFRHRSAEAFTERPASQRGSVECYAVESFPSFIAVLSLPRPEASLRPHRPRTPRSSMRSMAVGMAGSVSSFSPTG